MSPSPAIYQTIAEKRREKAQATIRTMHRNKLSDIAFKAGALAVGGWWPELAPLTTKERAAVIAAVDQAFPNRGAA